MNRKLCIIAGFGPGMGFAIAKRFAREGFDLVLLARHPDPALIEALERFGGRVTAYPTDLSRVETIGDVMASVRTDHGPADVLVYNGGAWNEGPPLAMRSEDFHRDLALCIVGAYACAQAVAGDMRARSGGVILFTGGGLALHPAYGVNVLSLVAGKSGLRGLGLALHDALKPDGIHVGMVTIAGVVASDTAFDPDRIADRYWDLVQEPKAEWTAEIVFTG
ncbi:SDR family NAD(P)-dependent oxidoreductase [Brevundimonas sp.]|uniref:SDR family NAD(P)-dependent oxidoreductase n=1 Tax=Brevundimonas sp. TaxID=1871086 RepID=UPI0026350816|nr:SDR family NAD(P)-dependent oxidoreductase [Brevundimonas sp.]